MSTRMDKYAETPTLKSRTEKNKALYEQMKNAEIEQFDVESNATVISEDYNVIDVDKIRDMLDKRYRENIPKRHMIEKNDEEEIIDNIHNTKEYDINTILEKAKSDQNVDYDKERLKKVHDTQYDILKNLNIKDNESIYNEETEENIVDLINTITALELKNKEGNTTALDLLSDLKDNDVDSLYKTMELDKDDVTKEEKVKNLTLNDNFEDFKELEKDINSNNIAIKIVGIVFLIVIIIIVILILKKYI